MSHHSIRDRLLVGLIGLAAQLLSARAESSTPIWIAQMGTQKMEWAKAISADGKGGIYISGRIQGVAGESDAYQSDAFLSKYDADGNSLWLRRFGSTFHSEDSYSVSADALGNVFMSGKNYLNLGIPASRQYLNKYDANGNVLWSRELEGAEYNSGVSADGVGGAYTSGATWGAVGGPNAGLTDALVTRYDDAGNLLWERQLGTSAYDGADAVSADHLGGMYVAGTTTGSFDVANAGGVDSFLSRYDDSGNLQWTRQFGSHRVDRAWSVSADGLGNAYVFGDVGDTDGQATGGPPGNVDAILTKFDSSGELQWTRQFGSQLDDYGSAVSADGLGNVYVTGITFGDLAAQNRGNRDVFVRKYSSDGTPIWTHQFGTTTSDSMHGISADGHGNIYVAGNTGGDLGGPYGGAGDAFVAKYTEVPEPATQSCTLWGLSLVEFLRRSRRKACKRLQGSLAP